MTASIHKILKAACLVRCRHPHHDERGYTLTHHKAAGIIQVFFNSFELLDEAQRVLIAGGINAETPDRSDCCFLTVKITQERQLK